MIKINKNNITNKNTSVNISRELLDDEATLLIQINSLDQHDKTYILSILGIRNSKKQL